MIRMLFLAFAGGVAGYALRVTRTDWRHPSIEQDPPPLTSDPMDGCRCGCVALRVRMAHLEQQLNYWQHRGLEARL